MPPPMPNPAKRMTANPARPVARYRPGKAVKEEESSEEDDEEGQEVKQTVPVPRKPQPRPPQRSRPQAAAQIPDEDDDDYDDEGFVTDEDDELSPTTKTDLNSANVAVPAAKSLHTDRERQHVATRDVQSETRDEDSSDKEDSDEDENEEDEDSSSEEEAAPQRKFQRPTFIKKNARKTPFATLTTSQNISANDAEHGNQSETRDAVEAVDVDEQARRLAQADLMIKDKLERDALARAAGKKAWDDDDDLAPEDLVDDTDGLDPEAEYAAWRLRELQRLKRDREAMIAREKELEEIERRRNLTAEEREKEDREFLEKQKEEREEGRSQANYLSKYHHKGAFFQDDDAAELLRKRDLMGAKFADDVDKSALPEYMRIRDMTKLGKKGRTRYTDLKGEDTGRFGDEVKRWKGSGYDNARSRDGGGDMRGVDERFLPDRDRESGGPTASGANASAVGVRRRRSRSRSKSPRERRDESPRGGELYRPGARRRSYSRSQSLSRTPPPRRRRSPSPYDERDKDRDKRRRIET